MSLSDEIKAAIGGDGKSRHQTRCLYDYWAIKAEELEAERGRLREALHEIAETWAGSDGFIPETAPEGYLQHLLKQMYSIAVGTLK